MNKKLLLLVVVIFIWLPKVTAQIFPRDGASLNYRIIGFSFPPEDSGADYRVEIAKGYFNTADVFKRNIINSINASQEKIVIEVPSWGTSYTWRVVSLHKSTLAEFHHFTTGIVPGVDTSLARCRVLKTAETYKDAFFFQDKSKVLYNMAGAPVWYLPSDTGVSVSDLKITPQGTITFLSNNVPLEVNYNGDTLWRAPDGGLISGEIAENYNHEFTRLNNGNYMVLGNEHPIWELDAKDSNLFDKSDQSIIRDGKGHFFQKVEYGTLIEYDARGKIVWSWKSAAYFRENMNKMKNAKGTFNLSRGGNSFYFDEERNCVYFSIRMENSVLKVQYPEGTVSSVYSGGQGGIKDKVATNELFCGQHSCKVTQEGYLCLYNNKSCTLGGIPHVVVLAPPNAKNIAPEKVWDYTCIIESDPNSPEKVPSFRRGGNVMILPDSSFFISMCGTYSKVHIVSKDKRILWSVVAENRKDKRAEWGPMSSYRASIIPTRSKLEELIWHAHKK